jgi:phage-related protein
MAWTVDFYVGADGVAPVEVFLNRLPKKHRAKLLGLIAKLKEHGPTLPFPYSSQVDGRLRELRTRFGKTRLRILYFGDANQEFILLHEVVKDSEKLEKSDMETAKAGMAEHNRKLVRKAKSSNSDPKVQGE